MIPHSIIVFPFIVDFHANEAAPGIQRGHTASTGTHAVVKDHFIRISEGPDEVFH